MTDLDLDHHIDWFIYYIHLDSVVFSIGFKSGSVLFHSSAENEDHTCDVGGVHAMLFEVRFPQALEVLKDFFELLFHSQKLDQLPSTIGQVLKRLVGIIHGTIAFPAYTKLVGSSHLHHPHYRLHFILRLLTILPISFCLSFCLGFCLCLLLFRLCGLCTPFCLFSFLSRGRG